MLDTAVLVQAVINPASGFGRVLHERRHRFQPVNTAKIAAEYLSVMQRPAITRKHGVPEADVLSIIRGFIDSATLVDPPIVPRVCRDPNDDGFLASAEA